MNKILIVEDENMLLDMMSTYLKSENFDVTGVKKLRRRTKFSL